VYPLPSGSRVQQAIDSAGGFTSNANTTTVNLAAVVVDGQKLYVPRQGETNPLPQDSTIQPGELVELNSASVDLLLTLPGIGEDRAKAIIAYREKTGGFKTIEELQNIEGIGQATFDKLKNLVSVVPLP
jgi:competence protein ComEA